MTAATCRDCGAELLIRHEIVAGQCVECMYRDFLEGDRDGDPVGSGGECGAGGPAEEMRR